MTENRDLRERVALMLSDYGCDCRDFHPELPPCDRCRNKAAEILALLPSEPAPSGLPHAAPTGVLARVGFTYWDDGHSGPGWYYVHTEYPDEGSLFLGAKFDAAAWYEPALALVQELVESDPEAGSDEAITLDLLAGLVEVYEKSAALASSAATAPLTAAETARDVYLRLARMFRSGVNPELRADMTVDVMAAALAKWCEKQAGVDPAPGRGLSDAERAVVIARLREHAGDHGLHRGYTEDLIDRVAALGGEGMPWIVADTDPPDGTWAVVMRRRERYDTVAVARFVEGEGWLADAVGRVTPTHYQIIAAPGGGQKGTR